MARALTLISISAALLLGAPTVSSACTGTNLAPPELEPATAQRAVICLINERRRAHRERRLRERASLDESASGHSRAMVSSGFYSHISPNGATPLTRARAAGYLNGGRSGTVGEVLLWGTGGLATPREAVSSWIGSAGHRRVMLRSFWRHVGVGFMVGSPEDPSDTEAGTYTADFAYRHG